MHATRKIARQHFDLQKGSYLECVCYSGSCSSTSQASPSFLWAALSLYVCLFLNMGSAEKNRVGQITITITFLNFIWLHEKPL